MTNLTVLGGGAGSQTIAADASLRGDYDQVRLFELPDFADETLGPILETRKITLKGLQNNHKGVKRTGTAEIDIVTTDISEAIEGTDLIIIPIPAKGHAAFFEELIPHLEDGQIISLFPDNFGSLQLRKMIQERDREPDVIIGGWDTLGYGARIEKLGEVNCMSRGYRLRYSALPSKDSDEFFKALKDSPPLEPCQKIEKLDNVLAVGFVNPNPTVHIPGSVLNVGAMEVCENEKDVLAPGEDWSLYKHGMSPSISKVQYKFYKEIQKIAGSIGVKIPEAPERHFYEKHSIMRAAYDAPFYYQSPVYDISGPHSVEDRYFTEDVAFGAMMYYRLAEKFQVDIPVIESLIRLASIVSERDFFEEGLSLEDVGLADMTKKEILNYLNRGKKKK